MAENQVVAAGKSKEEVAYMLMKQLIGFASDSPSKPSREDYIRHYAAARQAVYGTAPQMVSNPIKTLGLRKTGS